MQFTTSQLLHVKYSFSFTAFELSGHVSFHVSNTFLKVRQTLTHDLVAFKEKYPGGEFVTGSTLSVGVGVSNDWNTGPV